MAISELEQKLIRLALDPAAAPGEIQSCAIKLVEQWRKRGLTAEQIFGQGGDPRSEPDYGLVKMPFGKHKGKRLKEIEPDYLIWLTRKMHEDGDESDLYRSMQAFLGYGPQGP